MPTSSRSVIAADAAVDPMDDLAGWLTRSNRLPAPDQQLVGGYDLGRMNRARTGLASLRRGCHSPADMTDHCGTTRAHRRIGMRRTDQR
jgi:hypothetical protein